MTKSSNQLSIACPSCDSQIEIDDLLRNQVRSEVESEMTLKVKEERREIANLRQKVSAEKAELDKAREDVATVVEAELAKKSKDIEAKATVKARKQLEVTMADSQSQIQELSAQVDQFKKSELELLKQKREIELERSQLKLQVARELDSGRQQLVEETKKQFAQEFELKIAEKDKQIGDLRKTADDLKRKADQGSQQLQGEVQELALEAMLESHFRHDKICPVAKGQSGADALQRVFDLDGRECNSILWESKRTKAWSKSWLEKLRDDQRNAKAAFAVLVSEALPAGITTFGLVEGVWVCSWSCIVPLATALRIGLIETAKANVAAEGQSEKMELVYQYLAGQEFQQRISGIVEAFVSLQTEMAKEKRSMNLIWGRRGKQLERAIANAAGFYGDLQGIVGASLPTLPELSLQKITEESNGVDPLKRGLSA